MSHPAAPQSGEPPTQPQPGWQPPNAPELPTNTMAILSLVCAFLFWPLGIAFGHIARKQIVRTGERGKGLALVALVISYAWGLGFLALLLIIAVFVASSANNAATTVSITAAATSPSVPTRTDSL